MKLIRRCLPEHLKQDPKGAIVNICSTAAMRGSAAGVAYTASKHAPRSNAQYGVGLRQRGCEIQRRDSEWSRRQRR